jgi:phage repressor protein C with HTH and peptisase S24 domain
MELSQRIAKVVEYSGKSIPKFADSVGFKTPQVIRELLKGNTKTVSFQVQERLKAAYPELNIDWLVTGDGDMILPSLTSEQKEKDIATLGVTDTRPRLPLNVTAGQNEILDGAMLSQCEQVPMVPMFPNYTFSMRVTGESMLPYISPGDELACLKIDEPSFLQWGRIYVLFTSQGVIVKKIFDTGDGIRCVSFNEGYPDFIVPKSEIYSFNLVIGLVRLCN